MQKKDIDWSSLGFGYVKTDKRFVAHYWSFSHQGEKNYRSV